MGWAVLKNVFRALGSCLTVTFIHEGNLQAMKVARQSAGASSWSEEGGLLVTLRFVDGVNTSPADIQPAFPLGAASIVNEATKQIPVV